MIIRFALYNNNNDFDMVATDYEEIATIKEYFENEYNQAFEVEIIDIERRGF